MNTPVVNELDDSSSEIPSLLVPMAGCKWILPTVSVAEMIPYQAPQARQTVVTDDIPEWYLGSLNWRGITVPMISYEVISGDPLPQALPESQLIILNSTGVCARLPFLGMPTQGIPRLNRLAANEISQNLEAKPRGYDDMMVSAAGDQAIIPNVSQLEQVVADLLDLA